MRTDECVCGNALFFDSSACVKCHRPAAMCPACGKLSTFEPADTGQVKCHHSSCGQMLKRCANYDSNGVCNRGIPVGDQAEFCNYCRLNIMIPDLSVTGNLQKWKRLEAAKRRVLHEVESLGLPLCVPGQVPLTFKFEADSAGRVATGHARGCITINIAEADDVQRELARVELGEPKRTLVGHFRHELGHYYWETLVQPTRLSAFHERFGNEANPSYKSAKDRYYQHGPAANWRSNYISAYASMHPWEDFAETFAAYLAMVTTVRTAAHFKLIPEVPDAFQSLLDRYRWIGIVANELNRDMGLLDLVPEVLMPPVVAKLKFIDELARSHVAAATS